MSLINQMLRDLQAQKGQAPKTGKALKPKKLERIPYLPLPLVLAGGGLALLVLIWWLSGALSELLFRHEMPRDPAGQMASGSTAAKQADFQQAEPALLVPDQLTNEERHAEPVVEQVLVESAPVAAIAEDRQRPDKQPSAAGAGIATKTVAASKPVTRKPVIKKTTQNNKSPAVKVTQKKKTAQPAPVAVNKPSRLHPDDLPGAVRSATPVDAEPVQMIARPGKVDATTPFGKAEEAYLDGLWALEQQREKLAVRSLQYALSVYPGHFKAREVLTETLAKAGQTGEAILLLTEGLDIAPDYMEFKKRYARLMIKQGDYDAAVKALLNNGLPDVAEDPEAHTILASLYQKLDENFLAAQTYRNLLVAWPQTGAFWVGLGSALEKQGLKPDAIECYERALATDKLRKDLSDYAKRRLKLL